MKARCARLLVVVLGGAVLGLAPAGAVSRRLPLGTEVQATANTYEYGTSPNAVRNSGHGLSAGIRRSNADPPRLDRDNRT